MNKRFWDVRHLLILHWLSTYIKAIMCVCLFIHHVPISVSIQFSFLERNMHLRMQNVAVPVVLPPQNLGSSRKFRSSPLSCLEIQMPLDSDSWIVLQRKQDLGSKWSSSGLPQLWVVFFLPSSYWKSPLKPSASSGTELEQWTGPTVFGRERLKHQIRLPSICLTNAEELKGINWSRVWD